MSGLQKFKLRRERPALPLSSSTISKPAPEPSSQADPITAAMDQAETDLPRLMTPKSVAEMLGLTERTLERWRITGEGPRFVKLSRSTVRYMLEDVTAFVMAGLRANTAQ